VTPWGRAITALRLLAVDPDGLGGIVLLARSGPARDAFLAALAKGAIRLHPAMPHDVLTGGIDVSASLAEGTLVRQRGLLQRSDAQMILTMAERTPRLMASALAQCLDANRGNTLVALDEHTPDEEPPCPALLDRLAFHVSFDGLGRHDIETAGTDIGTPLPLAQVQVPRHAIQDIVTLSVALGIHSLRAPTLAVNAARAHAALHERKTVSDADVSAASELVLAPRATQIPQPPQEPEQPDQPEPQQGQDSSDAGQQQDLPDELLLAAIQTALPPDLLSKTGSDKVKSGSGSGSGQKKIGNRKGRPLPPRESGSRAADARVDLIATLRAAIPWQKLRHASRPDRTGPIIHPADLRYKRYEDLSDRLLIFAVDASGSAALARLAEAKGAVELLLSEAYARRDHVALISFRGDSAEVLLPPTRSLVQTKRRLAELPGGGGTPLASGLKLGLETALTANRKGLSPVIIVLTDGRSNVALDGSANRKQAAEDAKAMALQIATQRIDAIVIDTGRRPERSLHELALSLRGHYVSLPRADAQSLSATVSHALQD
jgi:magnesium chelatase subunit D